MVWGTISLLMSDWKWNPRYDLDLGQRCLFILSFTYATSLFLNFTFLNYLVSDLHLFILMTIALGLAFAKSAMQLPLGEKSVLVTGCDTGFGLTMAIDLHKKGFTVFAGCLLKAANGEGAKKLEEVSESSTLINKLYIIQLDVTKEEDWKEAVVLIKDKTGSNQLWGLVNNAGLSSFGEIEWVTVNCYRRLMEANMFAIIVGLQNCLPLIRRAKGRIVNTTSGLAMMSVPTRSPYVFSKYALRGFSDVLRYEMEAFGVKVSQIEPGNYIAGTKILTEEKIQEASNEMWENMSEQVKSDYGEKYFEDRVEIMKSYMGTGCSDQTPVIDAITNALSDAFPQKRYQPMNLYWKVRHFVSQHLPEIFYDWIYISYVRRS